MTEQTREVINLIEFLKRNIVSASRREHAARLLHQCEQHEQKDKQYNDYLIEMKGETNECKKSKHKGAAVSG